MGSDAPRIPHDAIARQESLPRGVRPLLMRRLGHDRPADGQPVDADHRRLYLICQGIYWIVLPGLLMLVGIVLSDKPVEPMPAESFSRPILGVLMGLALTHLVRFPIRLWGWKRLGWRPLIPRVAATTALLAAAWSAGDLGIDALLGREPWAADFTAGKTFLLRCLPGFVIFGGWLFAYFFFHLSDSLTRSEFDRLQLAAGAKEAELRALKSQINPHFIFNSLNSLRALIEEDPVKARSAVTRLAGLLRYALQSGQHETVSLEEELRIVKDYLALEQVRFDDRLRFHLDADEGVQALPVPPLLLQTLVENAVKYGIAPRPAGGEIAIRATREGSRLRLEVSNPGSLTPVAVPGEDESTGLGIRNAADRLRLLFGPEASLQIRAESPDRVRAEVLLPIGGLR